MSLTTIDDAGRLETVRLGMWAFLASELMFFGPLLLGWTYGRISMPDGFAWASRQTDLWLGTLNTAILLSSSAAMALAVQLSALQLKRQVGRCLLACAALGVAFLLIKFYEWHREWAEHLFPGPDFAGPAHTGAQYFFVVYFSATFLHAIHLTIGIGVTLAMWRRVHKAMGPLPQPALHAAGLYWHFVDVVWVALFPMLYLVERTP
ncbi:cytochrome c oxidase subunit 3 family protein [Silvimonas sp. JCM 19000]